MKRIVINLSLFVSVVLAAVFCFNCEQTGAVAQQTKNKEIPAPKKNLPVQKVEPVKPIKSIMGQDGIEMVFVPAGKFTMGTNAGGDDEKPAHEVYLDDYYIDRHEVTNKAYNECVARRRCGRVRPDSGFESPNQPVVGLNFYNAEKYCKFVGERLPTEAEWEKAARGIDSRPYPWGKNLDKTKAVYAAEATMPVGSMPAGSSPYGVMDMAGNAAEWTNDWYDAGYYKVSPQENPEGPKRGQNKVIRGGSYYSASQKLTTTFRLWERPKYEYPTYGVRCVKTEKN